MLATASTVLNIAVAVLDVVVIVMIIKHWRRKH